MNTPLSDAAALALIAMTAERDAALAKLSVARNALSDAAANIRFALASINTITHNQQ